jgi:hypothetical protein
MGETKFELEMNQEIEKRVKFFEENPEMKDQFSNTNYIFAFAFALVGLILTIIAAS